MKRTDKMIVREYFETVGDLLSYEMNDEHRRISEEVMRLITEIYGAEERFEECLRCVRDADAIQSAADAGLLEGMAPDLHGVSSDIKLGILLERKVLRQRRFDVDLALEELSEKAFLGERSAMRLLACFRLLGIGGECDGEAAVSILETLAMSGDDFAISALVYICREEGREELRRWEEVRSILE